MSIDPRIIAWEQHARKARTAMSILDLGAWLGLIAGLIFWAGFFWGMIAPATIVDSVLACALAAGYAVILPMLISLLAPSTPAGMALAETRWKTFGHTLSVAAALFMSYHAFRVLWAWWASRPAVAQTGEDLFLAIGTAIVFIIVPALAWVQIAPDRWVAEIAQAQQVRRMKAAQQANLMAAQLQYARAMALLRRGVANLTAAECEEVAGTLIAMQRAENEAIGQVADGMRLLTGIDTRIPLLDDPQLLDHYDRLTGQLERLIAPINDDYVELEPAPVARAAPEPPAVARAALAPATPPARPPVARPDTETVGSAVAGGRPAAARQGPSGAAQSTAVGVMDPVDRWLPVARRELTGAWKRADLERVLSISKTQANDLIRDWKECGELIDITSPAYHYSWTKEA